MLPPGDEDRLSCAWGCWLHEKARYWHETHAASLSDSIISMKSSIPQVLVVGAGPVGLASALALARLGISVRIIDQSTDVNIYSKALVLWRGSLKALNPFLDISLLTDAHPDFRGLKASSKEEAIAYMSFEDDSRGIKPGVFIPQYETESCLINALESNGVTIERGVGLKSFTHSETGVIASLESEQGIENLEIPWMIACDGGHSTVRKALGLKFEGVTAERRWLIADVDIDQDEDVHSLQIIRNTHGVVVGFPIEGRRWRLLVDGGEVSDDGEIQVTVEEIQAAIDDRTSLGWTITNHYWLTHFHINERQVDDYVIGRVLLAGDAAHVHTPAGGQGMNTGLQDAINLAWKLAMVLHEQAPESLMRSYQSERHPVGRAVIKGSALIMRAAMHTSPLSMGLGKVLLPMISSLSMIRKKAIAFLTEDSISYRESPLAGIRPEGVTHGPGDLFPDYIIRTKDGCQNPATVLLSDPGFTLVAFGESVETQSLIDLFSQSGLPLHVRHVHTDGDAEDFDGHLARAFNLSAAGYVLVRPDSFIAVVSNDAGRVTEWLSGLTSGRYMNGI